MRTWPYPRWIAHRGAGKLAPENTLAAFRLGASYGYRMFECDIKLSADDVPFLLHDTTLERTTDGKGDARALPWSALATLDAGSSHSATFAREPLPDFETIARFCIDGQYFLNIEIKPTPGLEAATGKDVANAAAALWKNAATPPLLTSFKTSSLRAAKLAQPQLPRGLLLDQWTDAWLKTALDLDCVAIVCKHRLWDAPALQLAKNAGLRTLAYTVNDQTSAEKLLALGLDGIITDRVDLFRPDA
jgi:glycerophosphoryl diester phosphodiesterase